MIRIMDLIPRALSAGAAAETVAETEMELVERIVFSVEKTFLGLGRVFLVLAILYGVVLLMKLFFHDIPNRKKNEKSKVESHGKKNKAASSDVEAPPAPVSVTPAVASVPTPASDADARLTAAITAAIAVYLEKEAAQNGALPTGFRVVSYQKRSGAWNRRG